MSRLRQPAIPRDAELLDESDWQDALEDLDGYSFFASPSWGRILSDAGLGYRSRALAFDFRGMRGLLPVVWKTDVFGRAIYQSSAFSTYGGLIPLGGYAEHRSADFGAEVERQLRRTSDFGLLIANPGPRGHFPFPAVFDRYLAYAIDLEARSPEQINADMRPKTRQYIRKADRDGVRVETATSIEDFRAYYRLLEASALRWGRTNPGKPWTLFQAIQRCGADGSARLWMARLGDQPAAGLLCFYGKGEVFAWSAALDERHVVSRANYLLHARAIHDAAERRFKVFNMGANEGLLGVKWFKEGLGATPREYPAYVVAQPAYAAAFWAWRKTRSAVAALRPAQGRTS